MKKQNKKENVMSMYDKYVPIKNIVKKTHKRECDQYV